MDRAIAKGVAHKIAEAVESDAQAIADVHMAAFKDNGMLLAQFPTPAVREQLRLCIARKAADDIRDPKVAVLVIYSEGELISFAKWSLPISPLEKYEEASWVWPEETDFAVLERWTERVLAAHERVMEDRPCYGKLCCISDVYFLSPLTEDFCGLFPQDAAFKASTAVSNDSTSILGNALKAVGISFIATLPTYEGHGAASALIQWGIDKCLKDKIPIYLESTLNAAALYEKLGFKAVERISLQLNETNTYDEIGLLYEP